MANRPYTTTQAPAQPIVPIPLPGPGGVVGTAAEVVAGNVIEAGQEATTAAGNAAAALGWILQPGAWVRIVKIALGGALIIVSIQMLITSKTLPVVERVVGVGTRAKSAAAAAGKVVS